MPNQLAFSKHPNIVYVQCKDPNAKMRGSEVRHREFWVWRQDVDYLCAQLILGFRRGQTCF